MTERQPTDSEWLWDHPFRFQFKSDGLCMTLSRCDTPVMHVLMESSDKSQPGDPVRKAFTDIGQAANAVLYIATTLVTTIGLQESWELIYQLAKWRHRWHTATGNGPIYLPKGAVLN